MTGLFVFFFPKVRNLSHISGKIIFFFPWKERSTLTQRKVKQTTFYFDLQMPSAQYLISQSKLTLISAKGGEKNP